MVNGIAGIVVTFEVLAIAAMVAAAFAPAQFWAVSGLQPPPWSRAGMQMAETRKSKASPDPFDFGEMG